MSLTLGNQSLNHNQFKVLIFGTFTESKDKTQSSVADTPTWVPVKSENPIQNLHFVVSGIGFTFRPEIRVLSGQFLYFVMFFGPQMSKNCYVGL